ncbi:MAG: hypothetical protein GVY19_02050 [Bacteroidetes bacterium]|jgi:nucleoid DNA-binding protein|nr:hypothetical protein [Bacteroidota bacterium]
MHTYLKELLNSNNRVIIPDFGAFIVKHGAKRLVIFNEFLKYNDGLLIEHIAQKENISKENASKKVSDFVNQVTQQLKTDKKYVLGDFGKLEMNHLNKIIFQQESSVKETTPKEDKTSTTASQPKKEGTTTPSSSQPDKQTTSAPASPKQPVEKDKETTPTEDTGKKPTEAKKETPKPEPKKEEAPKVPTTAAKAISTEKPTGIISSTKPTYTPPKKQEKKADPKRQKMISTTVIILANILLIVAILIVRDQLGFGDDKKDTGKVVLTPQNTDDEASADDESTNQPQATNASEEEGNNEAMQDEAREIADEITKDLQTNNARTKEAVNKNDAANSPNQYYVVAGCFSVEQNADRFVTTLRKKGYAAEKFGVINNLHAVSYESFPTFDQAQRALNQIHRSETQNAWVYKMN